MALHVLLQLQNLTYLKNGNSKFIPCPIQVNAISPTCIAPCNRAPCDVIHQSLMTSLFHSVEVILRAEIVESVQPGDKCDFIGTLVVVPDVSQLASADSRPRARATRGEAGTGTRRRECAG